MSDTLSIGLDFGTTNTVITTITPTGERLHHSYPSSFGESRNFRSLICYWEDDDRGVSVLDHSSGPYGISDYLEWGSDQRLIMSMKSYLGDTSFSRTQILGRQLSIENMIAHFLSDMLEKTGLDLSEHRVKISAGRPVVFVGARADEQLALTRLRAALGNAGLKDVQFIYEPAAAGYRFGKSSEAKGHVLVADFGGGTSDFSILKLKREGAQLYQPVAHSGIGLAGDRFDSQIFNHAIAPMLGKGSEYRSFGKDLRIPWQNGNFMWHRMSLMNNKKDLQFWKNLQRYAHEPEKIDRLIRVIEEGLLFQINRVVLQTKEALSQSMETLIDMREIGLDIVITVTRDDFEKWIAEDLQKIEACVQVVLDQAELPPDQVDRVFMTGGTSYIPAVRAIFAQKFGADKLSGGNEFSSVADGLAEMAFDQITDQS
ncbi:MAG: Hsp70 family protein [Sneathiella sp.]